MHGYWRYWGMSQACLATTSYSFPKGQEEQDPAASLKRSKVWRRLRRRHLDTVPALNQVPPAPWTGLTPPWELPCHRSYPCLVHQPPPFEVLLCSTDHPQAGVGGVCHDTSSYTVSAFLCKVGVAHCPGQDSLGEGVLLLLLLILLFLLIFLLLLPSFSSTWQEEPK